MNKIGVIINTRRPHVGDVLEELGRKAAELGLSLVAEDSSTAEVIGAEVAPLDDFPQKVDVTLAMGGDGTVLRVARALNGSGIPIMGVNLGSLGFLTSVGDSEIDAALGALANDQCKSSTRSVAGCNIFQDGKLVGEERALNDIVLGWGASSRIVTLKLSVDGEPIASFMCDGMIVSTPTGSTGHALSAGGPILHPGICGFGINVICAHALSSRPLIVPDGSLIEIEVTSATKELILSIDGQDEYKVEEGARIEIRKSPHGVQFLQLPGHSYFSILSQKLHWRGSSLPQ